MGVTIEEVTSSGTKQQTRTVVSPEITNCNVNQENENKKTLTNQKAVVASGRTAGNKRLAKVSTKGMRSIGSFFGAAKPKKPKL